jgi:hypothetical protein
MLVARRDPPFHPGAYDAAHALGVQAAPVHSRFMTALQIIGSVLAIPVGLASGYSIYHANFSTEAHCQGLRANIVSMLDKSADASTLRMLVRRDVAAFEQTCGAVDPNAVAAFKTLLAAGKAAPPDRLARAPAPQAKAAPAQPARVRPAPAVAAAKPARHDNASDVNWIATVRRALVREPVSHGETAQPAMPRQAAAPPHPLGQLIVPAVTQGTAAAAAPALPPPSSVANVPAPANAQNHPVPPASIPDAAPMPQPVEAVPAATHSGSGLTGLMAKLPLLGHVVGR